MNSLAIRLLTVALVTVVASAALAIPPRWFLEQMEDPYDVLKRLDEARYYAPPIEADSTHEYDVAKYIVRNDLDEALHNTDGHTTMIGTTNVAVTTLSFHLAAFTIDSLKLDGSSVTYSDLGDSIVVNTGALGASTPFVLDVYYHGTPVANHGLFFETNPYGDLYPHTFAEPYDARYWFPCYDLPFDKAYLETHTTVPSSFKVLSNGQLDSVVSSGGRSTYYWRHDYEIATYLVSLACGIYSVEHDTSNTQAGPIPVMYYAYPADSSDASYDWRNTPDMVAFYSDSASNYPFEKYSMAMLPFGFGGAMEHQTCTSMHHWLVNGTGSYEWIVAHELAHMWFGDYVTLVDFRHIWLNESFATYFDALYSRHAYGYNTYRGRLAGFRAQQDWTWNHPIFDPPQLFGSSVYEKGALVLRMIHHQVGEATWWQIIQSYTAAYAYGNAASDEFIAEVETATGEDWDWFFDEWIYGPGQPHYWWSYTVDDLGGGMYRVSVGVQQIQTSFPLFTMPIEILIERTAGDTTVIAWDSLAWQQFSWDVPGPVSGIRFDPDTVIIGARACVGVDDLAPLPTDVSLLPAYPNPFNPSTTISFELPESAVVRLEVFDALGRRVTTLAAGPTGPGRHEVVWNGRDASGRTVGSGVYFARLTADDAIRTGKMVLLK